MSRENVDSLKDRLKKEPYFKIIEGIQIDSRQFETHPEAHHLRKYSWEGMLSISFETDSHTADNAVAEQRRNDVISMMMDNLIRFKWKLRQKEVIWISTTEFGESGNGHCHILFNFLPLTKKGKLIPDIKFFEAQSWDTLQYVCGVLGCPRSSVESHFEMKFDNEGLVNYFTKKEKGQKDYKHFLYSSNPSTWIQENDEKEVTQ